MISTESFQLRQPAHESEIGNMIPSTIEDLQTEKVSAFVRKSRHLISNNDESLEGLEMSNVFWQFRDRVERNIEVDEVDHLAYNIWKKAKLVVRDGEVLQGAQAGKIPWQFLHTVVVHAERGKLRDTIKPRIIQIGNPIR
jgi:hypothetical protein